MSYREKMEKKIPQELLHDKNFLLWIESSIKRMDEKTACEPREDCGVEESESGLMLDGGKLSYEDIAAYTELTIEE